MENRQIIITTKQVNRLQELEKILIKHKNLLGLGEENIIVGISEKPRAFLAWHEEEKKWGIYILPSDNDFTPIHELGHLFLAKKSNYVYFARSGVKSNNIFSGILLIVNHLIDCFVDYNLIQFEGIYELYIDDAHLWICAKKKGKIEGKPIDIAHSYKALIGYYLSSKIINERKNREHFINVKNYLRKSKKLIQRSFPNIRFNFQSLEQKLDDFDKIKNTKDPTVILNFVYNILSEVSIWKESDIQQQMKLLFPNLKYF
ncbi:hypothetical protein LCGC14_0498190 [marine sediment metagenome]|uniref:Uncharacterized protein n=1 Tax=marine sediment metagenome TaxID=412755 RepID=A0A0F9S4M5_9ZZZZ|nr:hypothetical protein [bacterium]